ncbi:MAG: rod shape-determining protein RodA [Candidatus Azotimanducaceae bacterium]
MSKDFVRTISGIQTSKGALLLNRINIDHILLPLICTVILFGLLILRSASNGDEGVVFSQSIRIGLGFILMLSVAQIPGHFFFRWAPYLYLFSILLLLLVIFVGVEAKGGKRWLELPGLFRFQPSELIKLTLPMVLAWYFHDKLVPPGFRDILYAMGMISLPVLLIRFQPDLGTGVLVGLSGLAIVFFAGVKWRWLAYAGGTTLLLSPLLWFSMTEYQQGRVLTLLDPQSDPLGAGWQTIQATTAIGSGGISGKGLSMGTQSYLEFLPETKTDFIAAVLGEELGLLGLSILIFLYGFIIVRCIFMAVQSGSTFGRLLSGSLVFGFFCYVFVNMGMVCGLLPIVGVPLPLVSYGGTSIVSLMIGFGVIMSMRFHKAW